MTVFMHTLLEASFWRGFFKTEVSVYIGGAIAAASL
jgi:hypothetical protein